MSTLSDRELALDRATTHHRHAQRHAEFALAARQNAAMYAGNGHGFTHAEAALRLKGCQERAANHAKLEVAALLKLNEALIEAGYGPGEFTTIGRHRYRVCNPGQMARHVGIELPTDSLDEEMARAYEPIVEARDEAAERRSEWFDSIRVFGV